MNKERFTTILSERRSILGWKVAFVILTVLGVEAIISQDPTHPNTSATTTVRPMDYYDSIDTTRINPPYAVDPYNHQHEMAIDCAFYEDPSSHTFVIDPYDYAGNPIVYRLPQGTSGIAVHEIDNYSPNNTDIGWSDGFLVAVSKDNVTISGTVDGLDLPPAIYTGSNSPNGTFTLPTGYIAEGSFALADYDIEDNNNQFYLSLACDPQKTDELLQRDNSIIKNSIKIDKEGV